MAEPLARKPKEKTSPVSLMKVFLDLKWINDKNATKADSAVCEYKRIFKVSRDILFLFLNVH
jgi:hypothetical protein